MMTRRQLAELLLSAKRSARRSGAIPVPNREKLTAMGLTEPDIEQVEWAVREIERVTEAQLRALQ
jgi:hypothetical protein